MNFSVAILTLNEEINIASAIKSSEGCDDIIVLDSFSTDSTVEKARALGAKVYQRQFDNFANQRNYLLDNLETRYRWIFFLDADERLTPLLIEECNKVVNENKYSACYVAPKIMFQNKWIRHASQYPVYQVRFVKKDEMRFESWGHGQKEGWVKRGIGKLKEPYIHYIMSRGLDEWMRKHERYAADEAEMIARERLSFYQFWREMINGDAISRRRAMKKIAGNCRLRPFLRFAYLYFLHLGMLDGMAGLEYCRLMFIYEKMILNKLSQRKV